jgi:hypothetical protein
MFALIGLFDAVPDALHRVQSLGAFRRRFRDKQVNRTRSRRGVVEVPESDLLEIRDHNAVDLELYARVIHGDRTAVMPS